MTTHDGPQSISAANLKKRYGERAVVDGVAIDVRRGEVVGLLGPNGAGKTTSFYMIMGLVQPDGGEVTLGETKITRWPMHKRARAGIGYLAQDKSIFHKLSVEDNLRAILELMPISRRAQDTRCEELLVEFDLQDRRRSPGYALSGGERRRTEIARALATSPHFLLLDEPFAGVDPINRQEIQQIVLRLKGKGIGILLTDHNEMATLDIIDRGYILCDGKVLVEGSAQTLLSDRTAREVYFGESFGRQ
ncbi:MAG TPA: LPS export ABC transporter ATP-binding protein [Abditibacteriaceae bacterium]|jgi:lipopolysaccharide export system ATP-binding protein